MDGDPTGVITAEIMNWTGKVVGVPRSLLEKLAGRPEASRTGVYVLAGDDPDIPSTERVYVGESDDVFKRLKKHQDDDSKDFWTRTLLVVSKDENLNKAHVRYLEARLLSLAKEADRATLANGTHPPLPALPEPDVADMEFFLDQLQILLPVLGFSFARPLPTLEDENPAVPKEVSPTFCMSPVGTQATAREVNGEFVVKKGSTARVGGVASWTSYRTLRDKLVKEGKLVPNEGGGLYVFAEDVSFASPSAAAAVVFAGNQNGRLAWKVGGNGATYKEWQESKIEDAAGGGPIG